MNTLDKQYQGILRKLIMYGNEKEDRMVQVHYLTLEKLSDMI